MFFRGARTGGLTKLAESQASDMTIMSIAGHVNKRMLEHYIRIRVEAKRAALDAIAGPVFEVGVHQNEHTSKRAIPPLLVSR